VKSPFMKDQIKEEEDESGLTEELDKSNEK
jgi:hypothetical protein